MLLGTLLAASLAACSAGSHSASPADAADKVTRAVYANDLDATSADFDEATKRTITRSELGDMSDRMHALGAYRGLTQRSAAPDAGKYEYDAAFANGRLIVQLRVDPDGKIGAYRIVPDGAPSSAASAKN